MPALVVIGAQWGDEGKGKMVDVLSSQADIVVRYQGGANAGHTLKVKGEKLILHLLPSAVFHPQVKGLIGPGVVLDLEELCEEIQQLKKIGKLQNEDQLLISDSAGLLLDTHKQLDQAREEQAHKGKIGTTGKGIGPAYESRASRKALLFADIFEKDELLLKKLKEHSKETQVLLETLYNKKASSAEEMFEKIVKFRKLLKAYRCQNTSYFLHKSLQENKKILFEGAQGTLLDLFHGTYPYVTSSSTLAGAVLSSCGLGASSFKNTIAIAKAYTTRVGAGPFPTECEDPSKGKHLREKGEEFGATTGRQRRCGWLDLPALKYALRLNGAVSLALMKLDVLTGLDEIKICTAYQIDSQVVEDFFPLLIANSKKIKPIYKTFKSWKEDISHIKQKKQLPSSALAYIDFISKETGLPIDMISVGPSRSQTLYKDKDFFKAT